MPGFPCDENLSDGIADDDLDSAQPVLQFVPSETVQSLLWRNLPSKLLSCEWGDRLKEKRQAIPPNFERNIVAGFVASHPGSESGSADSEHDLAAMVHDFLENGSCCTDFCDSTDSDNGCSNVAKLLEKLQALKSSATSTEKDLQSAITFLLRSIKETDLICIKAGAECKGSCIRRLLVKNLRLSGYDAAVCISKWQSSGKLPGGEHEYIDLNFEENGRLILDIDFRSHFEIARPTHTYLTSLKFLPLNFVGSVEKLEQILHVMAEAAKLSLKQNSMPLPPWRTYGYMSAKWMSPYQRKLNDFQGGVWRGSCSLQRRDLSRTKQCVEQLRHLKTCFSSESDNQLTKSFTVEKTRGIVPKEHRRPPTWIAQQIA